MKSSKTSKAKPSAAVAVAEVQRRKLWPYAAGIAATLILVFQVYWPVMGGPFMLDDTYLPYMNSGYASAPLTTLTSAIGFTVSMVLLAGIRSTALRSA